MLKKILCIIFPLLLSIIPGNAYASDDYAEYNTYIEAMEIKITATDNFVFHVQQKITAHLNDEHGIFVNVNFQPGVNVIENIDVKGPGTYELSRDDGSNNTMIETIKIGDEDKEYTGNKTWIVSYDIIGFQTTEDKQNDLSLSLIPAYWELPIKKVKTTVIMPKSVNWNQMKMVSGNPDNQPTPLKQDKRFKINKTDKTLVIEGKNLPIKYGASIGGPLPKHYWKEPEIINSFLDTQFIFEMLLLLIAILCLFVFRRKNKPIETIEFYPPDKFDPVKMGYFIDGKVDNKDIISMLFYFANEGFIKIEKNGKNNFKFIKQKNAVGFTDYQKTILNGLFKKRNTFETKNINDDFLDCLRTVKEQVPESIPKIYTRPSLIVKNILLCIGFITEVAIIFFNRDILGYDSDFFMLILLCGLSYGIYYFSYCLHRKNSIESSSTLRDKFKFIILVISYLFIFSILLPPVFSNKLFEIICGLLFVSYFIIVHFTKKRHDKWLKLDGKILGFKKFIESAELEQLTNLVEENPEYFYRILPYAYIFGLTNKWAKNFEHIISYQPSWYNGSIVSYSEWNNAFCATINDAQNKILINESSEWITSSDSSSSSGGSSSGGGFGSGGGGTW